MKTDAGLLQFLQGGGDTGALIRAKNWADTPLGPIEGWPQSLKTTLGILLNSRYPMFVFWGPQLIKIYNDGYRPILGGKHPQALGKPAREVWPEIWGDIEPLVTRALDGDPTWSDDLMLFLERNGFPEESYFTFSYSPVTDESGGVGGMFCAVIETTAQVLGERRLRTLRDLAAALADTTSERDVCVRSADLLHANAADAPFVLIYLLDSDDSAILAAQAGVMTGDPVAPAVIHHGEPSWPIHEAIERRSDRLVTELRSRFANIPQGPWPEPPGAAMVLPLIDRGGDRAIGAIVLGISARRPFDADYQGWFGLVAGQVSASIITARAVEQERRRAEALADLDRAKTAFFSSVSHEFRTPLTLMLGPTEEALRSADEALRGEALQMVHRNQLRLLKLVNSLLDFSRIEAGRAEARREATDLSALTESLAAVFRSAIERAGLRLIVNCPPLAAPVMIDRDMWEKILFNLVANAFKFTFEGEIEVSLHVTGHHVVLAVRDTGIGIPNEELPRVFERFHRVAGARGRSFEGSGIGLALVHELVTLLGGTMSVISEVGSGSTFTVALPSAALANTGEGEALALPLSSTATTPDSFLEELLRTLPHEGPLAAAPAPGDGPRPRILVADDNADMRAYISGLLSPACDVIAVADGEAALMVLRDQPVDLVLSDVMMPRLDGVELLARVRADERTRTVPVILVSARAGEEETIAGLHVGADDYLVKPFGARELVARVNARLEIAAERRRRESELTASNERKDEFLAMLAHELRNPLAPIRSAAEVLRMADPSGTPHLWAREVIERQVQHLTRLVDDLLDVSRITRGIVTIRREPLDLSTIVQRSVETSRPVIDARHHVLTVTLPSRQICIEGDLTRLVQVVANLLNNAAKYTEEGGQIWVEVGEENGMGTVRVRDNGIGLAPDLLPHVFDLFTQANRSLDRSQGGLGVGLTLVHRLVALHGGSVQARSEGPGRGSEFIIQLPMLPESLAPDPVAPSNGNAVHGTPRQLRVLVVEDHVDSAEMMALIIGAAGHEVHKASDGASALEAAMTHRPDVIICDIGLPGMNGYELAARIRQRPELKGTHLIAITGYGREEDRRRAKDAGFDAHLTKPIEPKVLHSLLQFGVDRV